MNEPKTISRYRLTSELGRGGMGVVYRAEDPQLGRDVAVKVILFPHQADAEFRTQLEKRFEREARAAAGLHHPGVITVYDFGRDGDYLFLVMELIDGESLANRLRQGWRPSREEALEIAAQAAEALAVAHGAGVVHRDVTPHNILLAQDGRIVVTDFGVAHSFGEETLELTQTGMLVGSPGYMAPELVRNRDFDGRADLFSLGVILHRLLTGRKAFDGRDVTSLLYQIVHEDPLQDPAVLDAIDPETRRFLEKCMAKSPSERIADGDTFAREARRLKSIDPGTIPTEAPTLPGDLPAMSSTGATVARNPDLEVTFALSQAGQRFAAQARPARGRRMLWALLALAVLGSAWLGYSFLQKDRPHPPRIETAASHPTDRAASIPAFEVSSAVDAAPDESDDPPPEELTIAQDPSPPGPALAIDRAPPPPPGEARNPPPSRARNPPPSSPGPPRSDLTPRPVREPPPAETISSRNTPPGAETEPEADIVAPEADIVAPVLAIDAHPDEMTSSRITLSGRVMDDRGSVMLSIDGESLTVGEDGEFSTSRQLVPGRNVFTFLALDDAGNQTLKSIEVSSPVPGEPAGQARAENAAARPNQGGGPRRPVQQRFRDPGDGTLIDNLTGMTWTKRPSGEAQTFKEARTYCKKLELGRQSDWTVPTIEELEELYWAGSPGGSRTGQRQASLSFPEHTVWSSSKNRGTAWAFDFGRGQRSELDTALAARAFCVRRPSLLNRRPPSRFGPDPRSPGGEPNLRPPGGRPGGGGGGGPGGGRSQGRPPGGGP